MAFSMVRCLRCNKAFFPADITQGIFRRRCPNNKCKAENEFKFFRQYTQRDGKIKETIISITRIVDNTKAQEYSDNR